MTATYYKATCPNGTDFYTGTIQYEVGKRVRPAPHQGERRICGPGVLHAANAPGETLLGGSWPCRLFEVTGTPIDGFNGRHKHKGAFKQLQVVAELPSWMALGPNGQYVAGIIERSRNLTPGELDAFADGDADWYADWYAARYAARYAAWDAAGDAARYAAWDAARYAAWDAAWYAAGDAARDAARYAAGDAARYAALAHLTRDLITPRQFDALYAPWAVVIDKAEAQ